MKIETSLKQIDEKYLYFGDYFFFPPGVEWFSEDSF
jgi:hypothetical protein